MVVICDVSAWEYHRTPPAIKAIELEPEALPPNAPAERLLADSYTHTRSNAREAERLIISRLFTDLKGLSLPVHVMVDSRCSRHGSGLLHVHCLPKTLRSNMLESLGAGLYVLSPEYAVLAHCQHRSVVQVAKMMLEACGIFSLCPHNARVHRSTQTLVEQGLLTEGLIPRDRRIYFHQSDQAKRAPYVDKNGELFPWSPCFNRKGLLTGLWKRPPLTTSDQLAFAASNAAGLRGLPISRQALALCNDGAASPAEAQALLLLCADARMGGEGLPKPLLNAKIPFSSEAKLLGSSSYAVADCLWPQEKRILEVNGMDYHADRDGFLIQTGRTPALESMGYTVAELTPAQMADLETFDAMIPILALKLGFKPKKRTSHFLRARNLLHEELFLKSWEPVWTGTRRLKNE